MQLNLVRVVWRVDSITLTPIITDGIGEDGAVLVESRSRDGTADRRVALESVLRDSVPEVECSV